MKNLPLMLYQARLRHRAKVSFDSSMLCVVFSINRCRFESALLLLSEADGKFFLARRLDVSFALRKKLSMEQAQIRGGVYGEECVYREKTTVCTMSAVHLSKYDIDWWRHFAPPVGFLVQVEPGVTYYHAARLRSQHFRRCSKQSSL